jgi:hypothetical protein
LRSPLQPGTCLSDCLTHPPDAKSPAAPNDLGEPVGYVGSGFLVAQRFQHAQQGRGEFVTESHKCGHLELIQKVPAFSLAVPRVSGVPLPDIKWASAEVSTGCSSLGTESTLSSTTPDGSHVPWAWGSPPSGLALAASLGWGRWWPERGRRQVMRSGMRGTGTGRGRPGLPGWIQDLSPGIGWAVS